MKTLVTTVGILLSTIVFSQNVGINSTGATPHTTAALDISSTTKGVLIPRMTQTQRNAITSPATSLIIYQTDNTPGFRFYNGSTWQSLGSSLWWVNNGGVMTTSDVGIGGNPSPSYTLTVGGIGTYINSYLDVDGTAEADKLEVNAMAAALGCDTLAHFDFTGASNCAVGVAIENSNGGPALDVVSNSLIAGDVAINTSGQVGLRSIGSRYGIQSIADTAIYAQGIGKFEKQIIVGDSLGTIPVSGSIMFEAGSFQGYNGTSWVPLSGGSSLWSVSGSDIYRGTGNVGIGLTNPTYAFDAHGDMRLSPASANADFLISNNGIEPTFLPGINNYGYIGSGANRFYQGHYTNLTVYAAFTNLSDRRIKENIKPINNALGQILQLEGKQYDLKREFIMGNDVLTEEKESALEASRLDKLGFIAQELELVFPELVHENEETGLKSVDYIGLIPVLVEGMKEQQAQIESLKAEVEALQSQTQE